MSDMSSNPRPPSIAEARSPSDAALLERTLFEVKRVIVGQDRMVERMLVCLLARGHCLIEGVPGLAKTLAVETLASSVGGSFVRLQFTPDLVPADIVGTRIYRPSREAFDVELGPGVRQLRAGGRDQPGPRQGAVGPARGDGRGPRLDRRHHPSGAAAVPGAGDPEPHRVGRRLLASRGAARPLPHEDRRGLPERLRGGRDRPSHGRRPAARRRGARHRDARAAATRRRPGLRAQRGHGLRGAHRAHDPRAGRTWPARDRAAHRVRGEPPRQPRARSPPGARSR